MRNIVFLVASLIFLANISFSATAINTCLDSNANITAPGEYFLNFTVAGAPNTADNNVYGCIMINSSDILFDCNGFSMNGAGVGNDSAIVVYGNGTDRLTNVTIQNCPNINGYNFSGISFGQTENSTVQNVTIVNSTSAVFVAQSNNLLITNNTIRNTTANGVAIFLQTSHSNNVTNNILISDASYNAYQGIRSELNSENNTIDNNSVSGYDTGISLSTVHNNTIRNNIVSNTNGFGIIVDSSSVNSTVENNHIYNSTMTALGVHSSTNTTVTSNIIEHAIGGMQFNFNSYNITAANNTVSDTQLAAFASNSSLVSYTDDHFYNNTVDFQTNGSGMGISLTNEIFDSPAGNFTNYTNLSLNDTVSEEYAISWANRTMQLSKGYRTFNEKFINISNLTTNISIDQISWSYNDAEIGSENESRIQLWRYNNSWSHLQDANTATNTITLSNLASTGIYGVLILSADPCPAPITTSTTLTNDLIGSPNSASDLISGAVSCVKIAASDVTFDCNGFDMFDNQTVQTSLGIAVNSSWNNVTIKNCNVSDYEYGIYTKDLNHGQILNNTIENNTVGLELLNDSFNLIEFNTIMLNADTGFIGTGIVNDNIILNHFELNNHSIQIQNNSQNNAFLGNNITNNTYYGLNIVNSTNNSIIENVARNNAVGFSINTGSSTTELVGNIAEGNNQGFGINVASNITMDSNNASHNNHSYFVSNSSNITIVNSNATYDSEGGITINQSTILNVTNNAINNPELFGIYIGNTTNSTFENNQIYNSANQSGIGVYISNGSNNNNLLYNNMQNHSYGFLSVSNSNNLFYGNTVCNNFGSSGNGAAFYLENVSSEYILNNTMCSNKRGVYIANSSTQNLVQLNNLTQNNRGITVDGSNLNNLTMNTILEGDGGILLTNANLTVINQNNISQTNGTGIKIEDDASLNEIFLNQIFDTQETAISLETSSNQIYSNMIYGISDAGMQISGSSNTINNNTIHDSLLGMLIEDSDLTTVNNNTIYSNQITGIAMFATINSTIVNNTIHGNNPTVIPSFMDLDLAGIIMVQGQYNSITNNSVFDNAVYGINVNGSDTITLSSNSVYNNSIGNLLISGSNNTLVQNDHYYQNSFGVYVRNFGPDSLILNISNLSLSQEANYTNYTSLSLYDIVEPSAYYINWSTNTTDLPANYTSFEQKFIDISNLTENVSLESLVITWNNAELTGYTESQFVLYNYDGSNWSDTTATLSTSTNRLTLTSASNLGIFGVLQAPAGSMPSPSTPPTSSGSSSSSTPSLRVSLDMQCNNNTITTNVGGVSVNVVDEDSGSSFYSGTTDSGGEVMFNSCGRTVRIYANRDGYRSADEQFVLDSCTCLGSTEQPPVVPTPTPAPGQNTTIPPVNNTPEAPVTFTGPTNGTLGSTVTFTVTNCDGCTVRVELPNGQNITVPVINGKVELPLTAAGNYRLTLLRNGEVVSSLSMAAMGNNTIPTQPINNTPTPNPTPQQPSESNNDMGFAIWIIIILVVIGGVAYYYMRRTRV